MSFFFLLYLLILPDAVTVFSKRRPDPLGLLFRDIQQQDPSLRSDDRLRVAMVLEFHRIEVHAQHGAQTRQGWNRESPTGPLAPPCSSACSSACPPLVSVSALTYLPSVLLLRCHQRNLRHSRFLPA